MIYCVGTRLLFLYSPSTAMAAMLAMHASTVGIIIAKPRAVGPGQSTHASRRQEKWFKKLNGLEIISLAGHRHGIEKRACGEVRCI